MGYDESSLLGEIEQILGVGSLAKSEAKQNGDLTGRISPPAGFTLKDSPKHISQNTYDTQSISKSEVLNSITSSVKTTTVSNKWMRTTSGGYVKAPSHESILDVGDGDKNPEGTGYEDSSPQPPQRPDPPTFEADPCYYTESSQEPIGSPKFLPKSASVTNKSPSSNIKTQQSPVKLGLVPQDAPEDFRGPTPPARGESSDSCRVGVQATLNKIPIGYSPSNRGKDGVFTSLTAWRVTTNTMSLSNCVLKFTTSNVSYVQWCLTQSES